MAVTRGPAPYVHMRPASDLPSLSKRLERQNSLPAADPSSLTDDPAVDPGPKVENRSATQEERN